MSVEIERKYVIEKPEEELLLAMPGYEKSDILQIYLESAPGETHRIRARCYGEKTVYTETVKRRIDKISAYEDEAEISYFEFSELEKRIAKGSKALVKTRHSFSYCGKTVEIDVYPEWGSSAIMEIELSARDEAVEIPDFIRIKK